MSLAEKDLLEILELLERSPWEELHLETSSFKLTISKRGRPFDDAPGTEAAAPEAKSAAPVEAKPAAAGGAPPAGVFVVTAPTLGNFYVAPEHGAPPFVRAGQRVRPDDTVAIVEVMKLMNPVPAGIAGTVLEVRAANGELVEYGQDLVWITPADRVEG